MRLIGLTGGIASGKSAVASMLRAHGIPVIDADELARAAVARGSPGLAAVVERFGKDVLQPDETLDRKKLGEMVFVDEEKRRALNSIVHPEVARLAMERLGELQQTDAPLAVYEVPLLFESGLQSMMDKTLLVAAPAHVQLDRLIRRDGLSPEQARARIAAQMPVEDKRRLADAVLENDSDLTALAHRLRTAWLALTGSDTRFHPADLR